MNDTPELYVGTFKVPADILLSWRAAVELVFAERDLKVSPLAGLDGVVRQVLGRRRHAEPVEYVYLIAPPRDVRARLNVHGYTEQHCRLRWKAARDELAARRRRWAEQEGEEPDAGAEALENMTWEEWIAGVREPLPPTPTKRGLRRRRPWHAMDLMGMISDPIVSLRLMLEALEEPVWLDCDYLYLYEEDTSASPHGLARQDEAMSGRWPEGRITVLTEGRSDARLVSAALRALHPELSDAFQFLDFDEFRIEGGASPLARMVKGLAGTKMGSRMLAMFDNDAAGVEAMQELSTLRLPPNVCVMALPEIPLARRYPTLGPGGSKTMDVNGGATAIELYLGKGPLTGADGELRPVRWTEWRPKIGRYQGAVEGKQEVAQAFLRDLEAGGTPPALPRRFPDMDRLLRAMSSAFEDLRPNP